ncbi:hypothetical protein [Streptomyces sp. HUAS CX7]|nr:hypothetical protein [Streptomyces sp. HUAS CX7]WKX23662.1 hypothetical protein Q3Y68_36865 [Streptomyces sp. HUAS CX7]
MVCRGLVRVLYREAGDPHGQLDYTHAIDREMKHAATALAVHIACGD